MNKKLEPGKFSTKFNTGKTVITVIILNLSQLAMIAALLFYIMDAGGRINFLTEPWLIIILFIVLTAIAINSIIAFKNRESLLRSAFQFGLLQDTLLKLEGLNATLRSQRHDFMNHLQVVHSLIEMNEYKDAGEYIEKIYGDIQKVSRVLKTSNPAVNALLQAKMMTCEKSGINMELNVTTQLKDLKIPAWEFCRVLGNLLDNAVYALEGKSGSKLIRVELYEDLKYYYFSVINNGEPIHGHLAEKIFEQGFTTKGDKGEGMGLFISREIVRNYDGCIDVKSDVNETIFYGRVLK